MGESLRTTVETKLALALRKNTSLLEEKSNLPYAIINVDSKQPCQHLFHVEPNSLPQTGGEDAVIKSKFAVVTGDGSLLIYDTMFRRAVWKHSWENDNPMDGVNWGEIVLDTMLLNSRQLGYFSTSLTPPPVSEEEKEKPQHPPVMMHSRDPHSGFCKPCMLPRTNLSLGVSAILIVPIGLDKIGVHNFSREDKKLEEDRVIEIYKLDAILMCMKPLKFESDGVTTTALLACGTESGCIEILQLKIHQPPSKERDLAPASPTASLSSNCNCSCNLISKFQLPKNKKESLPCVSTSMEFHEELNILIVGTTSDPIYLLQLHTDTDPFCLKPLAKKTLPSSGVGCMSLDKRKQVLATGCYDGIIRTFDFPEMNPISSFNYHSASGHYINSLLFMEDVSQGQGENRKFLVCATSIGIISVWLTGKPTGNALK